MLLQLENYIILNTVANKVKVDEDFVWETANSIRWLSQTFKEKFKIEKFLFGEVYASYFGTAPELTVSLMEELGYDKDDNLDETNSSANSSPSTSILVTPNKSPSVSNQIPTATSVSKNANNYSQFNEQASKELSQSNSSLKLAHRLGSFSNPTLLREDSNSSNSCAFTGRVNSLFEDYNQSNDVDSHENDDYISSQNNEDRDRDSDDLLNDFIRKKP